MRDAFFLTIVFAGAPICLFRPYFGILLWIFISIITPGGLAWGFAAQIPSALIVAVATLLGTFVAATNMRFLPKQMLLFLLLWGWFGVTYVHATQVELFSPHMAESLRQLEEVSKILLMSFLTVLLVTSKEKLRWLLLVTTFSLGLLAAKGAIWGIVTMGQWRVYGTPGSFIGDNNDFALALNMTLAMPFFLAHEERNAKMRFVLRFLFAASVICVVLSYSRGGLLGLAAVLGVIAVKSQRKLLAVFLLCIIAVGLVTLTTDAWKNRMGEFLHGDLDQSAISRLNTWDFAWRLARAYPITGGGFACFTPELIARFKPEFHEATTHGPHSIYFQILAEHGFVGLAFFLSLLGSCWYMLRRLRKRSRGQPGLEWVSNYSHIIEVGFVGYLVGGAFLGRAYFDLFYELIACAVIITIVYSRTVAVNMRATQSLPPEESSGAAKTF